MTFSDWALVCMGLLTACGGAGCWLCWHLAAVDGFDRGRDYERERQANRELRARRAADRARDRRTAPSLAARPPWYATVPPRPRPGRVVTTAGEWPVTVVPVGPATIPLRHQPSNISGAGTVTMSALTTTGELRAITDEFLEGLAARAERDRQEITS